MEYNVTLPPLSIDHPVFSLRGPLGLQPPFINSPEPGSASSPPSAVIQQREGEGLTGDGACLLSHKSPFTPPRKTKPLYLPPDNDDESPDNGYIIDPETGEIFASLPVHGLFDTTEIIWEKASQDDCKYWLQIYSKDLKVKRPCIQANEGQKGKRGKIWQFSKASRNRLLFLCRNSGHHIQSQFCCTFHNSWPLDGKSIKGMIERLIKRVRRKVGPDLHYIWVLEFQEREAPHVHLFTDLPATRENRWFLADAWLDVSEQNGDPLCRRFHRNPKNFFTWEMKTGDYLVKEYIGKIEQKEVPEAFKNVGCFWNKSRNMNPEFSTLDPQDHDEGTKILIDQALRITTRLHEKTIDQHKSFGVQFDRSLSLFGVPADEIPAKIKKQIALGIRLHGSYKTTRLRPKTNYRRRSQTVNLANKADIYLDVLNWLMAPPKPSGYRAFSTWIDNWSTDLSESRSPRYQVTNERTPF